MMIALRDLHQPAHSFLPSILETDEPRYVNVEAKLGYC